LSYYPSKERFSRLSVAFTLDSKEEVKDFFEALQIYWHLLDFKKFQEKLKEKETEIAQLEKEIESLKEEKSQVESELVRLRSELYDLRIAKAEKGNTLQNEDIKTIRE